MKTLVYLIIVLGIISCNDNSSSKNVKTVLFAHRDAPIGGIWIELKDNQTFTAGYKRGEKSEGTYQIKQDTVILNPETKLIRAIDSLLLINDETLNYVTFQGGLSITLNELLPK